MILQLVATILFALPCAAAAQAYVPVQDREQGVTSGSEVEMVYIGASDCFACVQPTYKAALEQAKVLLADRAEAEGKTFVAIDVSTDYDLDAGYDFLKASGGFDELVIGRNWFNSAVLEHLIRTEGAEDRVLGLPTIVLYEQEAMMGDTIQATPPRYLRYIAGGAELPEWVEAGVPLE